MVKHGEREGEQLGNYHLIRLLGYGGFADVYLGEHLYLKSHAALKVLRTELSDEDVARFLAEAQTLARLRHPQIVRVHDFAVEQGTPFLAMDYAPRGTLRQHHSHGSCLSLDTVVTYVRHVASALQYAHNHDMIHRDVKPENMLLGAEQEVLLSDFGLALFAPSPELLSTQEMAGAFPYMAPEQLQGKPCFASDQYALGIVVYEWLCGVCPFEGSYWQLLNEHVSALPPPLREKDPSLPEAVESVVLKALAKNPEHRYVSIQLFAQALELASQGETGVLSNDSEVTGRLNVISLAPPVLVEPVGGVKGALTKHAEFVDALAWPRRNEPGKDELAFLRASEAERKRQETTGRERQAREVELQRRAAVRQRYIIGLMAVTSVIVIVALVVGLVLQTQLLSSQTQLLSSQTQLLKSLPASVTNLNDSGSGSLRDAIQHAASGGTITFAKNLSGTIFLTHDELELAKNITLSGSSDRNITLDARHMSRVFQIDKGITAVISNLTIMNGNGSTKYNNGGSSGNGGGIYADNNSTLVLIGSQIIHNTASLGAGIYSAGELSISNSTIANNVASGFGSVGGIVSYGQLTLTNSKVLHNTGGGSGGIFILGGGSASISKCIIDGNKGNNGSGGIISYGNMSIVNSTIANNISTTSGNGGGISNYGYGHLTLENSTISDNKTDGNGGGIDNTGSITIGYSTIYNNSAMKGGGIANEGISVYTYSGNPPYAISTSIIAGNQAANGPDIAGSVTLSYPNLIQNPSGAIISLDQYNDPKQPITGESPRLTPLQTDASYPNAPPTHALLPGSPAIDQVPPGVYCGSPGGYLFMVSDERGVSRPQGKGCDLGAYEYVPKT